MDCRYRLLFLFLCGFAEPTVSTQKCDEKVLEKTSCSLKMTIPRGQTLTEVKWVHKSGEIHWKKQKIKGNIPGASLGENKTSITFESVSVDNSGTYTYSAFDSIGREISAGKVEITVYANINKATVIDICEKGNVTLSCDTGGIKNVDITWLKDGSNVRAGKDLKLVLPASQIQEGQPYSCIAENPLSKKESEKKTVSCSVPGLDKLFGFDFWIMVSILASGGALLLLLICVLIICACRSCRHRKKHQQDEAELRLQTFHESENGGTHRSKHTARGQPAPPIPQEEPINGSPSPQTTPRIAAQPKAQTRARPPPPPQDDDGEDPPPLPRPRNKQRKHRTQEPYRPME